MVSARRRGESPRDTRPAPAVPGWFVEVVCRRGRRGDVVHLSQEGNTGRTVAQAPEALTIVIGYDGSDTARRALSHVGRLLPTATRVVVVAVTPQLGSPATSPEPLVGHAFDAERLVAEASEAIGRPDGTTIECRTASGEPAEVLVAVTREVGADLLIVGRRGSDFVARVLLGSVAQRVIQDARCDVLVVA